MWPRWTNSSPSCTKHSKTTWWTWITSRSSWNPTKPIRPIGRNLLNSIVTGNYIISIFQLSNKNVVQAILIWKCQIADFLLEKKTCYGHQHSWKFKFHSLITSSAAIRLTFKTKKNPTKFFCFFAKTFSLPLIININILLAYPFSRFYRIWPDLLIFIPSSMIKFFFGEGVYISYYLDLKFFFIKFHPHQGLVSPDNVKKKRISAVQFL